MSTHSFRITDLAPEAQRVVRELNLDTSGPVGTPDGRISRDDLPRLDEVLRRQDISHDAREMVRSIRNAAFDPLAVPRTDTRARAIATAAAAAKPGEAAVALSIDDVRSMTVEERLAAVDAIANKRGTSGFAAFFGVGRVNNPREQAILRIIESTPEHQLPTFVDKLVSSGLNRRLVSVMHGKEYEQFKTFMRSQIWSLNSAQDIARAMSDFGVIRELAATVDTITRVRSQRGDAMAEQVVSTLYAQGSFRPLLNFVYWSAPSFECRDVLDLTAEATYRARIELTIQQHRNQLERFLTVFPPNSPTARAIQADFDQYHNLQRIMSGVDLARCALEIISQPGSPDRPRGREDRSGDSAAPPITPRVREDRSGDSAAPPITPRVREDRSGDSAPPPITPRVREDRSGDSAPPPIGR